MAEQMTPAALAAIEALVSTVRAGAADFSLDPSSALLADECEMLLAHIRTMEAEREDLLAENDRLQEQVVDWPKWATDCVALLKRYGYEPEIDGVDLPEDIATWLEGFADTTAERDAEIAAAVARERERAITLLGDLLDQTATAFATMAERFSDDSQKKIAGLVGELLTSLKDDAAAAIREPKP